ncbi:MAG: phosphoethanolamine transferase [Gammaproteobacteria bacterium]
MTRTAPPTSAAELSTTSTARVAALVLSLWLLSPALHVAVSSLQSGHTSHAFAVLALAAAVFATPLAFVHTPRAFFLLWLPVALWVPVQLFLLNLFGGTPGPIFFSALLNTDPVETKATMAGIGLVALLLPASWILYVWTATLPSLRVPMSVRFRNALLGLALLYGAAATLTHPDFGPTNVQTALWSDEVLTDSFPTGPVLGVTTALVQGRPERVGWIAASAPPDPQIVVLIIGETMRADHLGLYGYARDTTPKLGKIASELVIFRDMAASANSTFVALPNIASVKTPKGMLDVATIFRSAGFDTAWLSNQASHVYQSDARLKRFSEMNWNSSNRLDQELVPELAEVLKQEGERKFIVLHLIGSHYPYDLRYPESMRVFRPTESEVKGGFRPANKANYVNSYDNSILATDDMVARVIDMVRASGKPSVVALTADHGENLYDDKRNKILHSNPEASRAEAFVPLVIWANSGYAAKHPDRLARLRANRDQPAGHLNVVPTLVDLAGISSTYDPRMDSLAQADFRPRPRSLLQASGTMVQVDALK